MKKQYLFSFIIGLFTTLLVMSGTAMGKPLTAMKAHNDAGLTCESCHNTSNVVDSCLTCHANSNGTYRGELDKSGNGVEKEYPEAGKTRKAAIHDSHGGPIRCTVCHTAHKDTPEKLYCNNCHQFDVKIK